MHLSFDREDCEEIYARKRKLRELFPEAEKDLDKIVRRSGVHSTRGGLKRYCVGDVIDELEEEGYEIEFAPEPAIDDDGPVAQALCELKGTADYLSEQGSQLGGGRIHRIADEAADTLGLEIEAV